MNQNKRGRRITSMLMAVLMSVSTTLSPVNSVASESSVTVESQMEEAAIETVSEQTEANSSEETVPSDEAQTVEEITAEKTTAEKEDSVAEEVKTSGENEEETSANETRGSDENEEETTQEAEQTAAEETETETTSEEVPSIDLLAATKEEILSYIEAIGGNESDAFYAFIGGLEENDYQLVWMAQYGAEDDQLAEKFGFDYDAASDLDAAKYIHRLSEDERIDFVESMTFEQYRRYLSIKEMMAEMDEKDFTDAIDEEAFDADRVWDYDSYDAFAESMTGVSLQRTEQTMQFYNTYVDAAQVQAGVTTIDSLLDSNADWYSDDYILSLNPEMFKETVPVYYGSDGNYYVVSTVPTLNGVESADYQPATNFYNDSVAAEAFEDIQYLGNGVYCIPGSRYQYCYTEQYVSDAGALYGVSFGLRIQVLYGFTASGEVKISADVLYPDMTERFLPAVLNLASGTATVKIFNDDYDDTLDNYLVSASINRGESFPDGVSVINNGKTLQFVMGDNCAVGSLDVLIGYNATSKYSMTAQITTESLYQSESLDNGIALTAQLQGSYLEMARSSVPSDLAVGDKFVYANTRLTITGVNNAADGSGTIHVGATTVPTHDAQEFCLYSPYDETALNALNSWFKYSLSDANSASPGYLVQMTTENIQRRAASNGTSVNLGGQKIFGYLSEALGTSTSASGKILNLEGTQVILACMHAWHLEANTPAEVVNSVNSFTERTGEQETFAHDIGFGNYLPNIALQCTDVHDGDDGYTYATFKVVTSMLGIRGINNPNNYQCAFATLNIRYEKQQEGYLRIHKSSTNPEITNENSCYSFDDINYGIFTDAGCVNNIAILNLDANGYSEPLKLKAGTYYVREATATPGSGYRTNGEVYTVNVIAGTTADSPVMCEAKDVPLNDPFGIQIIKINKDGTTTADLSGAEYTITYYPKKYNTIAEIKADPKAEPTAWVIQTIKSASGYVASLDDKHVVSGSASAVFGKYKDGTYLIPLGTITVEETKAPTGFTKDGAVVSSAKTGETISGINNIYLFQIVDENSSVYLKSGNALSTPVDDESAVTLTYAEVQNKAGISIKKSDALTNGAASAGTLEGIKFAIVNATGSDIVNYAGQTISNGCVAQMITTDANGYAATGKADLPVGKYTIRELRADASFDGKNFSEGSSAMANEYYQWKDIQITVTITDENTKTVVNAGTVYDIPVRGDIQLVKKNSDTGETLAYIPFKITNNATGETHYVLTDTDGNFNSAIGKTTNTNANDSVLSQYGEKDIIPQSVIDSLAKDAGLWFGSTDANDSYGAFAYGKYTIVELKTEATKNMKMYTNTFTINAAGQALDFGTVNNVPMSIRTTLVDANGEHFTEATSTVILVDHVAYKNLDTDKNYTLTGTLYVKDGDALTELLTEMVDFTPTETNGTQDVTFTFDASALVGKSVVAFEELSLNGEFCAEHKDKNDENQTIYFPSVKTKAVDKNTGLNQVKEDSNVMIVDTVTYTGLQPGKTYTMTGMLMSSTGNAIVSNGKHITASTEFTPTESDGSIDVVFNFDATDGFGGCQYVFYEYLYLDGVSVAAHTDVSDTNQIIYIPSIQTTLIDSENGSHNSAADQDITLIDTVRYNGVEIGRAYTVTGTLVDRETGKEIVDDAGNKITASAEFTAEKTNGTVDVTFVFSGVSLAGKTIVAYEHMYTEGKEVAIHADVDDENQTVYIPQIHTTATDKITGDHDGVVAAETTVLDEVFYTNLLLGKEYTVKGTLMVKETGEPLTVDGKEVTAEKTFLAEEPDGSIILEFTFNSLALAGKHVVAFEDVKYEGISIGTHADIEDEEQTISYPSIHTAAADQTSNSKTMVLGTSVTLVDTVTYTGLTVGKSYVVKGTVMDKASSQPIGVTAETTFTADATDGSAVVTFTFDTTVLQGKTLVVFETLYDEQDNPIVDHSDLNDEDQTVSIPVQPEIPPVVTGDDSSPMPYAAGFTVAFLAAVVAAILLLKRKKA